MICWKCLTWGSGKDCEWCHATAPEILVATADRFMALVAAAMTDARLSEINAIDSAEIAMREIERRVEAGELWEVKP